MEEQQTDATALTSVNQSELERLRITNQALETGVSKQGITLNPVWFLAAIALATGFGGFWWWVDHSSRSSHGGYRVY